jgi:lipopolysaccharide transport system ATP-binding protein
MGKNIAIKVENLSKAYQLGQIGTGTISRDLERFWTTKIRGKEDPFLKIGQTNDRTVKGESDIVWSLKDINFEIEQGDAVGIIGRNGAGKSTLLKLLSRVTAPTTGNIKVKGRIASLLEVGTGFHPELTGRENIYLNGAILGMRRKEITRKFDEIVDFSGVERYIDTPVKRYSSGMYVRLAFAVAAHLESEILIVDEVLAVGDAEFQRKCLGKMGEVSKGEGRTVLFVSHNLQSINSLCKLSILLNNGNLDYYDRTELVIGQYNKQFNKSPKKITINNSGNELFILEDIFFTNGNKDRNITTRDEIHFELKFYFNVMITGLAIEMNVTNDLGILVFSSVSDTFTAFEGINFHSCIIPKCILNNINYNFSFRISKNQIAFLAKYEDIISIDVNNNLDITNGNNNLEGIVRPNIVWKLNQKVRI